jgi:hypothetical protein
MVGTSLTLLCPPYETAKLVNVVTTTTQHLLDREKIFSALLQLKDVSFIDPLLR